MLKFLNFIFNQLGLIVLLIAGGVWYFDYLEFSWTFLGATIIILGIILVVSKLFNQMVKDKINQK